MELYRLKIHELKELIDKKAISLVELIQATILRTQKSTKGMDNFITLDTENSLMLAKKVDKLLRDGNRLSSLGGIPFGVQDNICTRGLKTSCGSKMLNNYVPPYDASVVEKLRKEYAIIMGKLSMDEFGEGIGLAPAVARGQVFYGLGSDIAGGLRQSAARQGLVGFKPTQGLVSGYGLVACASSLESIGCIAKDVEDCTSVLGEIAFYDHKDSASIKSSKANYNKNLVDNVKALKIGISKQIFNENWDSNVRSSIDAALATYEGLGAQIIEIDIPHLKYAHSAHFIIMSAEVSSNLARYDGVRYGYRESDSEDLDIMYKNNRTLGFGHGVKKMIMLGNLFLTSEYYHSHYLKALKIRTLLKEDFKSAFERCNLVLTPTIVPSISKLDESNRWTLLANMTGLPAISIPCGFDYDGLPVGMQLIGDACQEDLLFRAAYTFKENVK